MRVVLDFEEVKKAVAWYVARKFTINPDCVTDVYIEFLDGYVTVYIKEDEEE